MSDEQALWARLEQEPPDWQTYLVLADLMEERGDAAVAGGLRWMAANRKRPYVSPHITVRAKRQWFDLAYSSPSIDPESNIDHDLFERLRGGHRTGICYYIYEYDDFRSATLALCEALVTPQE